MTLTALFFLIQAVAASIYLTLAVYISLRRTPQKVHLPFIVFALLEAFDAYSFFLTSSPQGPNVDLLIWLRLRWAGLALLPGIFLHMFHPLIREDLQKRMAVATIGAYVFGLATGLGLVFGDTISGTIYRGPAGGNLIDPVFNPTGFVLFVLWSLPALVAATWFLVFASRTPQQPRLRADASRLIQPWALLLLTIVFGIAAALLPPDSSSETGLVLKILAHTLAIVAGVMLARGILRFGSPVGRPIDPRLVPVILPVAVVVVIDFLLVYNSEQITTPLHLVRLVLISGVIGIVLARPQLLRRVARWLGPAMADDTFFALRMSLAWESLAEGSFNITLASESLLALQEELDAAYVGVLELAGAAEHQVLTFGRWEDGPRLTIHTDYLDWPLTEESLNEVEYMTSGLPGPPNIILPVHDDQSLAGILVIGEPMRGGIYSRNELRLAELLTSLLSFAIGHGLRLEEGPSVPRRIDAETVLLPNTNVAIRTFGRLEIYVQNGGSQTPRASLRARQILAILLSSYPDPVPAESLMEHLWPEQPPDSAANSLYVAIYALRRALEPGLRRGAVSRYVKRDSDCYQLMMDDELWVDFLEFLKLYWHGKDSIVRGQERAALVSYERALRMCRRPFLADSTLDLPAEVEVTRHRLQRFTHEMGWHLASESIETQRWDQAERALLQLLSIDPHDESARETLVEIYRKQGKEGLAVELESIGQED